jgi:Uma2 family endonuclease
MVASVSKPAEDLSWEELLRPDLLVHGAEPEQRIVFSGISWKRYLAFDKTLGDERPGPRLYYLDGELEVMSTSEEHEGIKKWIATFLEDFFFEHEFVIMPRGQATMRLALKQAGAEPDESWCIGPERKFPDLVLEIALSSGGIRKLDVYKRFAIPEVWIWRRNRLEVYVLGSTGEYQNALRSQVVPGLDIPLLERCVGITDWRKAKTAFREGLRRRK